MRNPSAFSFSCPSALRTGVAALIVATSAGCSALRDPHTYDKAANIACELLAQEKAKEAELQGASFADVEKAVKAACDAKDEIQPWIDALLAASREQDAIMGSTMGAVAREK